MSRLNGLLYFVRWQLYPVCRSIPGHVAFIARGFRPRVRCGLVARLRLAWHSLWIHLRVRCAHYPLELLLIMEEIAELPDERVGIVVECGAFLGGSSAKLTHAAFHSRRTLVVCDSFEGLPEVATDDHVEGKPDFHHGQYAGRLALVSRNVERFGAKGVPVEYVPGWFNVSLRALRGRAIACAFWDVDLQESFRDCLRALWRDVVPQAKVFIHDIGRDPVADVFRDRAWWERELHEVAPPLIGARNGRRSGLARAAPNVGYAHKLGTEPPPVGTAAPLGTLVTPPPPAPRSYA
jgi:O-methyltransferase